MDILLSFCNFWVGHGLGCWHSSSLDSFPISFSNRHFQIYSDWRAILTSNWRSPSPGLYMSPIFPDTKDKTSHPWPHTTIGRSTERASKCSGETPTTHSPTTLPAVSLVSTLRTSRQSSLCPVLWCMSSSHKKPRTPSYLSSFLPLVLKCLPSPRFLV